VASESIEVMFSASRRSRAPHRNRPRRLVRLALALILAGDPTAVSAAETEAPPVPAKASLMTLQPSLTPISDYTGESPWSGACALCFGEIGDQRQKLYDRGVALDLSLTQVPQGVVSGGRDHTWKYGGNADYLLALDSGRLGLWPGGLLVVHGRTKFGRSPLSQAGVLSPVNYNWLTPSLSENNESFLEEYYLFQGLTDWLLVGGGRILFGNIGDTNRFAGNAHTQFVNSALKNSPLLGVLTPALSLHGGFAMVTPDSHVTIAPFALSRNDEDGNYGSPGGLFSQVSAGAQLIVNWEIGSLPGEILPIAGYSSKNVTKLDNPYLLREALLGLAVPKKDGNWVAGFSADQYLYVPKTASARKPRTAALITEPEGIGVFARFHYSPENRNPWNVFASGGLGGRGVIPTRPDDRYGLGFYALFVSDELKKQPLVGGKLDTEWGLEFFYNLAIAPWLQLSPSLQYIESGLPGVDDSVVVTTRLQMVF